MDVGCDLSSEVISIVSRCLKGQQIAFGELFARYQGMVFGLCLRMLRHREEAEDATQETFVRVANNLHRWDATRSFEPWLLTIAGNRCRTRLAKRSRQPKHSTLDYPVEDKSHLQAGARQLAEEVETVLRDVRSECRQAFLLFYQHQLPYAQIAEVLNVPLGTVKTWVHRARRELIERLQQRGTVSA